MTSNNCKFIFVTGGVISSVGKGLTIASIGSLLQSMGFCVTLRKVDPYLNIDPGTMNPVQHGEVFVTDDGAETDLDLGHYERFTGINAASCDSTTAGKIYSNLINEERKGKYLGQTVQVIPHVTNLIKNFIYNKSNTLDFVLCEIGGTVGDIEGQPFFEAARQVAYEVGKQNVMYVHVTLVPYIKTSDEIKTKPTQHSVRALNALGIQPDLIICRTQKTISSENKKKIALFCSIQESNVIEAMDVENIYELPIKYKEQHLDEKILKVFGIEGRKADVTKWQQIANKVSLIKNEPVKKVKIAIIGKYSDLCDAYKSVFESIEHACFAQNLAQEIHIINARNLENLNLRGFDGIIIPGGFGFGGVDGKIAAIKHARENKIPLFGICLGFQLAVVEFAKNVLKLEDPNSTEFDQHCKNNVIGLLTEWQESDLSTQIRDQNSNLGGTMRLGAYECVLQEGSKAHNIYKKTVISERHRHRYEANTHYKAIFEENGLKFSGFCKLNSNIPEILELQGHPWFIGVQFHPEFKSKVFDPHPLFMSFVHACSEVKNQNSCAILN